MDGYAELRGGHVASVHGWVDNLGGVYCDRCARGGPALRLLPSGSVLVNLQYDQRQRVAPYLTAIYTVGDEGRSRLWRVRPYVTARVRSGFSFERGARYQHNVDAAQWYDDVSASAAADGARRTTSSRTSSSTC